MRSPRVKGDCGELQQSKEAQVHCSRRTDGRCERDEAREVSRD